MYTELEKIYYREGQEAYEQEYQARFNSPGSVKLKFDIQGHPGFFVHSEEVVKLGMSIHKLDKKVRDLSGGMPPIAIEQFYKKCLMDEVILTNRIEGVYTTRREISQILHKLKSESRKKGERDRYDGLVKQYLRLQEKKEIPLDTCQDVRSLYDELILDDVLKEDAGNRPDGQLFRKGGVSVVTPTQKEIHAGLYPEAAIQQAMEQAMRFLNDEDVALLYRACIFHYMIEYVHPFYDGNGRLGRFMMSYALTKELDPLVACRLSYTITENINEYYEAFKRCNKPRNRGDVTPFLLVMLRMVETAMERLFDALLERGRKLVHYIDILMPVIKNESKSMGDMYAFLLQGSLYSEEGVSMNDLKEASGKSENTIRSYLRKVEDRGLLKVCQGPVLGYELDLDAVDALEHNEK